MISTGEPSLVDGSSVFMQLENRCFSYIDIDNSKLGMSTTLNHVEITSGYEVIGNEPLNLVSSEEGFQIHKKIITSHGDENSNESGTKNPNMLEIKEPFESPTLMVLFLTQISFYILMFLYYISSFFPPKIVKEKNRDGYQPLLDRFSIFYSRYVFRRMRDCCDYPICSVAGNEIVVKERVTKDNGWTFEFTGSERKCINLGSYNYLGFAEKSGPCAEAAISSVYKYGISTGNSRQRYGTCELHDKLERLMAEFLGVEDVITFGMGFATNSLNIPTLLSPGSLVLSDEKNHSSIILGIRLGGVTVRVFKHNSVEHLERLLREAIYYGQPNQPEGVFKPWKKIVIFVEGVYSMDGTIVRLPEMIALKKKYKAYLYIDEAHSIGALGKKGVGVVDYFHCNPKDIDVFMGTYSKSFGSSGGYIAGTKELITCLREKSVASRHAWAMPPPLASQIISVLKILMGKDGTNEGRQRIERLARNTKYFKKRLRQMGLIIYGNEDSPVIPILAFHYSKIVAMLRALFKEKIATVGVGYPATPFSQGRIRICLSAELTKEQIDYSLNVIQKLVDEMGVKYSRKLSKNSPISFYKTNTYSDS
nr:serine palmitoyltransferase 2-like isoform X3 [Leptinotarsa decemlineata]